VPLKGQKKRASAPEVRVSQTAEQLEPAASSQKRPSPLHLLLDLRHSSVETQSIVVLDFGAQYSQLIARRIREQNVFSVVLPCTASIDEIRSYSPLGVILSGGPC
jgi:carbamoylphosphate synthase small subunit